MKSNRDIEIKPRRPMQKEMIKRARVKNHKCVSIRNRDRDMYRLYITCIDQYEKKVRPERERERVEWNKKWGIFERPWCYYIVLCHLSLVFCTSCVCVFVFVLFLRAANILSLITRWPKIFLRISLLFLVALFPFHFFYFLLLSSMWCIFTFCFQVVFDWLLCCSIFVFVADFL